MNDQVHIIKSLTKEEQELLCFSQPVGYHTRLQQYWEYPQGFQERTSPTSNAVGISTTKVFRRYLRDFIRLFPAEPLSTGNPLWLCLESNGRFSVKLGKTGEEITDLNDAEFLIFQYLCFLQIRHFWDGLRRRCRFPAVRLPVFIRDFSEQVKKQVDYDALLQRAADISSQVIIL